MSKTWEQYHPADTHYEWAPYHDERPTKYNEAEENEKAAHHAYLAHGHNQHAIRHSAETAKLQAKRCDKVVTPASEQGAKNKRSPKDS